MSSDAAALIASARDLYPVSPIFATSGVSRLKVTFFPSSDDGIVEASANVGKSINIMHIIISADKILFFIIPVSFFYMYLRNYK